MSSTSCGSRRRNCATRIGKGLIGPVSFTAGGDVELNPITVLRVAPGARSLTNFPDVVVDSVQRVPAALVR